MSMAVAVLPEEASRSPRPDFGHPPQGIVQHGFFSNESKQRDDLMPI